MERVLRIKRGLTVYRKCSDTGTSERISAHIQNIEVVHTNIDDDNNDDDNMLTQFRNHLKNLMSSNCLIMKGVPHAHYI